MSENEQSRQALVRNPCAGLTLVEMMVVLVILVIIAVVGLPNLLNGRISANEASVVQTMRSVSSAQATLKQMNAIDNEGVPDGSGEYGYLAEMAGSAELRGQGGELPSPVLGGKMGVVQDGVVTANGYHYALYMPGAGGVGVPEDPGGGKADPAELDPKLAEQYWLCYAWPANEGNTGVNIYVINEIGDIIQSNNRVQGYSGRSNPPEFDAAFLVDNDMTSGLAVDAEGADGGSWTAVR